MNKKEMVLNVNIENCLTFHLEKNERKVLKKTKSNNPPIIIKVI